MADSMFLIMAIALIGGATLVGFVIYDKTVVMGSRMDIQLEHIKSYDCEEMIKQHVTAHYLSAENKQFANEKVKSCESDLK